MARGFSPDQSAPAAELVKPAGASGIAGQSAFSASVSSLQLLIRLDVGKRWGRAHARTTVLFETRPLGPA
jgi:hypothetical protein